MLYPSQEGGIRTAYKQMTLKLRIRLQQKLEAGSPFADIARELGAKDTGTVLCSGHQAAAVGACAAPNPAAEVFTPAPRSGEQLAR